MASNFSRRGILTTGSGRRARGLVATSAAQVATASAAGSRKAASGSEETRSLDALYRDAAAEGGMLVIYAGGDTVSQQDTTVEAFRARFPDVDLTMVVDYSKYHDVRVDNQLATGTLVPDVVQLQTVQDFTRWKSQGKLLPYKPARSPATSPSTYC